MRVVRAQPAVTTGRSERRFHTCTVLYSLEPQSYEFARVLEHTQRGVRLHSNEKLAASIATKRTGIPGHRTCQPSSPSRNFFIFDVAAGWPTGGCEPSERGGNGKGRVHTNGA